MRRAWGTANPAGRTSGTSSAGCLRFVRGTEVCGPCRSVADRRHELWAAYGDGGMAPTTGSFARSVADRRHQLWVAYGDGGMAPTTGSFARSVPTATMMALISVQPVLRLIERDVGVGLEDVVVTSRPFFACHRGRDILADLGVGVGRPAGSA